MSSTLTLSSLSLLDLMVTLRHLHAKFILLSKKFYQQKNTPPKKRTLFFFIFSRRKRRCLLPLWHRKCQERTKIKHFFFTGTNIFIPHWITKQRITFPWKILCVLGYESAAYQSTFTDLKVERFYCRWKEKDEPKTHESFRVFSRIKWEKRKKRQFRESLFFLDFKKEERELSFFLE